jgi:hypothetical protein
MAVGVGTIVGPVAVAAGNFLLVQDFTAARHI